jgi:hypothetical protein
MIEGESIVAVSFAWPNIECIAPHNENCSKKPLYTALHILTTQNYPHNNRLPSLHNPLNLSSKKITLFRNL